MKSEGLLVPGLYKASPLDLQMVSLVYFLDEI